MDKVYFHLDVSPMPAPRPRARAILSRGRPIATIYNPSEYTKWKQDAADAFNDELDLILADLPKETFPLRGPLSVGIVVTVARPKSTKLSAPKPDSDNYAKAVLDAMTQAEIWEDDSQVEILLVKKQWGEVDGIDVEVTAGLIM